MKQRGKVNCNLLKNMIKNYMLVSCERSEVATAE
jgi:hypothetical protein